MAAIHLYGQSKLELSAGGNFTITIVGIVIFTIVNTITIVDLLNISIHNINTKHKFLNYYNKIQE